MKRVIINLNQLTTNREPPDESDEDFLKLVSSIQENGLFVPLLINDEIHVIDGMKRLAALKYLGYQESTVTIPDTLEEAIEVLDEAHLQFPGYRRAWEIRQDLEYLARRRRNENKGNRWSGKTRATKRPAHELLRQMLVDALKARSFSALDDALRLYRLRERPAIDPTTLTRVNKLIEQMEQGDISPLIANTLLSGERGLTGNVHGGKDQQDFLESAARNLEALVQGMKRLAAPVSVPATKLNTIINDLRSSRTELTRMIWLLTEEAKKNGS